MNIIKKIKKLYKLDTYFYQPHYEHSYYLVKRSLKKFNILLDKEINIKYKKKISNLTEDIYFIHKEFNDKFESIRIRTYLDGDYKYSANIIFALKNNKNKEEIYVTVHKNIYDLDDFIKKISIQLEEEFNFILKFYIEKNKTVFFIKNFIFNQHKIKEDYLSFAFEEVLNVYDVAHRKIEKNFFLSNYILEIEFAGQECKIKANEIKKYLCGTLSKSFQLLSKKHRKSFDIITNIINSSETPRKLDTLAVLNIK